MSNATVVKSRFPRAFSSFNKWLSSPGKFLEGFGQVAWFIVVAVGQIPMAIQRFRKATLRIIAEIGMGTGALTVAGGTTAIVGFVTLSGGSLIAIQGYASLGNIGVEAFTGFVAALANVRVVAPLVAGFALAATVGAGATPPRSSSTPSTPSSARAAPAPVASQVRPDPRSAGWCRAPGPTTTRPRSGACFSRSSFLRASKIRLTWCLP